MDTTVGFSTLLLSYTTYKEGQQQHIPLIRQQLVAAILTGSIPNPHVPLSIYDNPYNSLPFYPTAHRLLLSISPPQVPDHVYLPTQFPTVDLTSPDTYELDFILHGGGSPSLSPHTSPFPAPVYKNLHYLYYPP